MITRRFCTCSAIVALLACVVVSNASPDVSSVFPISTLAPDTPPIMEFQTSTYWILIVGFILAFTLAFGVGANDVANVFGTSVGAKVLTLRQACMIATVAEILGAILLGYKVSDTVRKGILDVTLYNNTEKELMLGSLAALGGSSLWNILATFLSLPISGTHSIIGATLGFTMCARGFDGVNWITFTKIVASWFVSPVLSGLMSAGIFIGIRHFILNKEKPLEPGLRSLPFFYGFTILVNVFSIVHDGPKMLHLDNLPWWGSICMSIAVGVLVASFVQCFIIPRQRKSITEGLQSYGGYNSNVKFTIGSTGKPEKNLAPGKTNLLSRAKKSLQSQSEPKHKIYQIENSRSPTPPGGLCEIEKGGGIPQVAPAALPLLSVDKNGYMPVPKKNSEISLDSECSKESKQDNGHLASHLDELSTVHSQVPLVKMSCAKEEDLCKEEEKDRYEVSRLFSFLQVLTATFGSFAHGGNDVSNAIGPLIALWAIYTEGSVAQKSETPIYILLYGGFGISVGLWIWGRRVIKTIGENLTKVTASSGFTIEIGSAFTVLMASKIGLPISTTHCKVGSVVFVGWAKSSRKGVDWKLFRNIVIAWVVTVPLTAGISALLMYILRLSFL